jgi:hypothetical protein
MVCGSPCGIFRAMSVFCGCPLRTKGEKRWRKFNIAKAMRLERFVESVKGCEADAEFRNRSLSCLGHPIS